MVRLTKRRRQDRFSDMMEINLYLIPYTLAGLVYVDYLTGTKIGREILSPAAEERIQQTGKHTVVIFTYVISLWAHSVNIISSATACLRQTCWLAPLFLTYVHEGYDAQNYTIHLSFQSE